MSETSGHLPVAEPPPPTPVQSDVFLSLLCAVVGLALVAGLAMVAHRDWLWLRRSPIEGPPPSPLPNRLKKDLLVLPKLSYEGAIAVAGRRHAECAICLAEFEERDEIRVLPPCEHSFYVDCVNRWLGSHSSCPSYRRVVVVFAASS